MYAKIIVNKHKNKKRYLKRKLRKFQNSVIKMIKNGEIAV